MAKVDVIDIRRQKVGEMEVNDRLLAEPVARRVELARRGRAANPAAVRRRFRLWQCIHLA